MSAITLQFDTAADFEAAISDALQNNEGAVPGIAAYVLREQSRDAGGAASGGQGEPQKYDDVLVPFVAAMRKELHANTRKGDRPGWLTMDANTALLEVYWHAAKLSAAVKNNDGPAIQEHSADVANMAMMVLDICGGLAWVDVEPVNCGCGVTCEDRMHACRYRIVGTGGAADRSSIQRAPTPPTDKELLDLAEDCNFSVWNRELYLKVVRAALGWRPKTAALSAAPPSPHPDHTGSEAVAPEAMPVTIFNALDEAAQTILGEETRNNVREWLRRAWHHNVCPAIEAAPPAPPAPPAPLPGKESAFLSAVATIYIDPHDERQELEYIGHIPRGELIRLYKAPNAVHADLLNVAIAVRDACHKAWVTSAENWRADVDVKSIVSAALSSPPAQAAPADYPPLPKLRTVEMLSDLQSGTIEVVPVWAVHEALRGYVDADRAQRSGVSADPMPDKKLWLWKNFVDGRPEYWAFDNPYPCRMDCWDPQTLGEPCGYALLKPSREGRTDWTEEKVLHAIKNARPAKE